ncbi:phosphatidate cytidylyltransferase [Stutzerimonas urumqiensis]|uniref:phosphatidate cytidylyltransferase n=1 Tax=Stutzerimonas urumqiensis TaxID=638269 RepID=UPI003BAB203E
MLKLRVITALVLLPVALVGFFWLEGLAFALFFGAIIALGAWEWARLAGFVGQAARCGFAVAVAILLSILYTQPGWSTPLVLLGALWWVLATALVMTYPASSRFWGGRFGSLAIGLLILLPAWLALLTLKQRPNGNWLIVAVMALVWVADIGAYFFGRALGRRKLAPMVSPGKSWEGLLGGLVCSLIVTVIVGVNIGLSLPQLAASLAGAAIVVLLSVVGDLTESMFKRKAGVKDSSQLLPGHGGVLDRIDSLTAAVPVFAALLWLSGWGI